MAYDPDKTLREEIVETLEEGLDTNLRGTEQVEATLVFTHLSNTPIIVIPDDVVLPPDLDQDTKDSMYLDIKTVLFENENPDERA